MRACILVPAYQEADYFDRALSHAMRQGYDVYVANDASTDATSNVVRYWGAEMYLNTNNTGKARCLKRTIDYFRLTEQYEYIFIMDADTVLADGHLELLLEHVKPDDAFLVGRIESNLADNKTLVGRYRAYVMHMYNLFIRRPQNLLGVVNVLPGSSVLLSSSVVDMLDWDEVASFSLDDYNIMVQIRRNHCGKCRYIHDTPPAYVLEPFTLRDYWEQTRRWWAGISEIEWRGGAWKNTSFWGLWNKLHLWSWLMSALWPVVYLILLLSTGGIILKVLVGLILWSSGVALALSTIYVLRTGRIGTYLSLPTFYIIMWVEALHFLLCYVMIIRSRNRGVWTSPTRR